MPGVVLTTWIALIQLLLRHPWTLILLIGEISALAMLFDCFVLGLRTAIRLTLLKLHVRWWHASARQTQTFLQRVGVPDSVLRMIPEVLFYLPSLS